MHDDVETVRCTTVRWRESSHGVVGVVFGGHSPGFGGVSLAGFGVLDSSQVRFGDVEGGEGVAVVAGETREGAFPAVVAAAVGRGVDQDDEVLDAAGDLTDRQFEAVLAAVDVGYYENPREGSVAEVAACIDCAPGTAAELLGRAESCVMGRVASTGVF